MGYEFAWDSCSMTVSAFQRARLGRQAPPGVSLQVLQVFVPLARGGLDRSHDGKSSHVFTPSLGACAFLALCHSGRRPISLAISLHRWCSWRRKSATCSGDFPGSTIGPIAEIL